MKVSRFGSVMALAVLLWCDVVSFAEAATLDELLELDLEELAHYPVVTPTKTKQPLSAAPGSITLITYDQIRRSTARTIPDLLRLVPGVNVRWNPMVQTIDIRSFGSNPFTSKVLLMIDGVPYNSWNKGGFPQHPGFDFFNIENVKHLEVVRGPGSALYGENALNGVINIVTLSGDEFQQTRASAYIGDRNTRTYNVTHGAKLNEEASIFASVRKSAGQLPSEIWSDEADANADAYDLFVKAKYQGWQASYYRRDDSFDGYRDVVVGPGVARTAEDIDQQVNIFSAAFAHQATDKSWSFETKASYSDRDGSHCAACHGPQQSSNFTKSADHGYQAFGTAQLGVHRVKNHDFLIGAEIRRLSAGDHSHEFEGAGSLNMMHGKGFDQGGDIVSYNKHALFFQDNIHLLDNKLNIVAGVRYDSKTSPMLFGSELFPRVAIVARPTRKLTLRAGWNRAARYPSFTELYQASWFLSTEVAGTATPLAVFSPGDDLQPEYIESFEFGVAYDFTKHLQGRLDFFQNDVEDPIVIAYPSAQRPSVLGFENHPNDARVRGVELAFNVVHSRDLSAFVNWAYQHNQEVGGGTDSAGYPLEFTYSSRHKINLGMTWNPSPAISTTLEVSWRDKYQVPAFWALLENGNARKNTFDGYAYLNFGVQYRLPFVVSGGKRPLTLSVHAKNLGNKRPQETLTGIGGPVPGREFFVRLEYDWIL